MIQGWLSALAVIGLLPAPLLLVAVAVAVAGFHLLFGAIFQLLSH
jgi:hypothetical protein